MPQAQNVTTDFFSWSINQMIEKNEFDVADLRREYT